jgi:hypothetical protein
VKIPDELSYISIYAKHRLGKPLEALTKEDWKKAALAASDVAEELYNLVYPARGKSGRPKKNRNALALLYSPAPVRPVGRPKQLFFGKYSIGVIDAILRDLQTKQSQISTRWPDAPKDRRNHLKALLRIFREETGRYHDLAAVERALRRHRARERTGRKTHPGGHNSS